MKRRTLLALICTPLPARAFQAQDAPADVQAAWAARCSGLSADAGQPPLCPFCGCALSGDATDHGERP